MKNHLRAYALLAALAWGVSVAPAGAWAAEQAVVTPLAKLAWTPAGIPGVSTAAVEGDMAKGPSHFFLKYDGGFVAPVHHHSPDHYVTIVSGTLVLTVDGREHRLTPGSFFALTGKAKHAARVEGDQPCVMFIDARGSWDVVLDPAGGEKK